MPRPWADGAPGCARVGQVWFSVHFAQVGFLDKPDFEIKARREHGRAGSRCGVRDSDGARHPDERHKGEHRVADVPEQPARDQADALSRVDTDPPRLAHVALCAVGADHASRHPSQSGDAGWRGASSWRLRAHGPDHSRHATGNGKSHGCPLDRRRSSPEPEPGVTGRAVL